MFGLLKKMREAKARKIAKANADSALRQAHARYQSAIRRGDTRDQHTASNDAKAAQTARLMIEMGRG